MLRRTLGLGSDDQGMGCVATFVLPIDKTMTGLWPVHHQGRAPIMGVLLVGKNSRLLYMCGSHSFRTVIVSDETENDNGAFAFSLKASHDLSLASNFVCQKPR